MSEDEGSVQDGGGRSERDTSPSEPPHKQRKLKDGPKHRRAAHGELEFLRSAMESEAYVYTMLLSLRSMSKSKAPLSADFNRRGRRSLPTMPEMGPEMRVHHSKKC